MPLPKLLAPAKTKKQARRARVPLKRLNAIIKKYRNKSSFWFLIKWVYIKKPQPDEKQLSIPLFLQFAGLWDKDTHELYCIYFGLKVEIGSLVALSCAAEIYKASEETQFQVQYQKESKLLNKKIKKLNRKYKGSIPNRFVLTVEQRRQRVKDLRQKRKRRQLEIKNQQRQIEQEKKLISRARLQKIKNIRSLKNIMNQQDNNVNKK